MDRDLEEFARRLEARAFLYGDPGSFREGVVEALREVAAARESAPPVTVGAVTRPVHRRIPPGR
jgi:hypothetical protein